MNFLFYIKFIFIEVSFPKYILCIIFSNFIYYLSLLFVEITSERCSIKKQKLTFFNIFFFIWKAEREKHFSSTDQLPNAHKSRGWATLKQAARNFIPGSYHGKQGLTCHSHHPLSPRVCAGKTLESEAESGRKHEIGHHKWCPELYSN